MVEMFGIANCDTIRKARRWLAEHDIACLFHDYKKEGVDARQLARWVERVGWEVLLNKRGTTWRKLSDADKMDLDRGKAIALMCAHPSMIKRPVLVSDDQIVVGFAEPQYSGLFI